MFINLQGSKKEKCCASVFFIWEKIPLKTQCHPVTMTITSRKSEDFYNPWKSSLFRRQNSTKLRSWKEKTFFARKLVRYQYITLIYIIYQNWIFVIIKFMFFSVNITKRYNTFVHFYTLHGNFLVFILVFISLLPILATVKK